MGNKVKYFFVFIIAFDVKLSLRLRKSFWYLKTQFFSSARCFYFSILYISPAMSLNEFGIALPEWLVREGNGYKVLLVYGTLFGLLLPFLVVCHICNFSFF